MLSGHPHVKAQSALTLHLTLPVLYSFNPKPSVLIDGLFAELTAPNQPKEINNE
jgi:hypothetical protein